MSDNHGLPTGKHTLVEEGTEFKGTMSSNCPIVVVGKIEGEVSGPMIHISQTGVVAGKVKVDQLQSTGVIAGEVEADVVKIAGKVRDHTVIRARTLEVSLSSKNGMEVVFGECELAIGNPLDKDVAIAAALASSDHAQAAGSPSSGDDEDEPNERIRSDEERPSRRAHSGTQPPPLS